MTAHEMIEALDLGYGHGEKQDALCDTAIEIVLGDFINYKLNESDDFTPVTIEYIPNTVY